ncbi:MAG: DUF4139 domain-containing protein [Sedimentisphaerales bacterium]|nr:DUF4139 domain-containing protein [Sedimentisphaerales bacterium]
MKQAKVQLTQNVVIVAIVFLGLASAAPAQDTPDVSADLQQVALFKNGLGFFVAHAKIPSGTNSFTVGPFAAAVHGTFWAAYPPQVNLKSLIAHEVDTLEPIAAVSIAELLRANVGKSVQLFLNTDKDQLISGTIMSVAQERSIPQPDPYAPGHNIDSSNYYSGRNISQPNLMLVETEQGIVAVNPYNVQRVVIPDKNMQTSFQLKRKTTQLQLHLDQPVNNQALTLSYLAKGITWAPSYMVDITDPNNARLAAKAVIMNEVTDLENVAVSLVTGYPNLKFSDIVSPLAQKQDLAQFLLALTKGQSELGRDGRGNIMSNVMSQSVSGYGGIISLDESMMPAYGSAQPGQVAEDLFYYPVENVNLKKGQVGYYPLFTDEIPYKHIYQWQIPDYVNEGDYYRYNQPDQQKDLPEVVWHCLRLENSMNLPWTTAPAEIIKSGKILGQDILNYTPANSMTTLKITQAVSVKAEQIEYETDRKRDAAQWYGSHYDLVTVKGELAVKNFQDKAITLEITKKLSGEVKSSEPDAKVAKLARGLRRANSQSQLTWTINLTPSQQTKLNYTFEVYVRR